MRSTEQDSLRWLWAVRRESPVPKTIDRIFEVQADGPDLAVFVPLRWEYRVRFNASCYYALYPGRKGILWFGWGGSFVIVDTERKLTITYAMNKMGDGVIGSPRSLASMLRLCMMLSRVEVDDRTRY